MLKLTKHWIQPCKWSIPVGWRKASLKIERLSKADARKLPSADVPSSSICLHPHTETHPKDESGNFALPDVLLWKVQMNALLQRVALRRWPTYFRGTICHVILCSVYNNVLRDTSYFYEHVKDKFTLCSDFLDVLNIKNAFHNLCCKTKRCGLSACCNETQNMEHLGDFYFPVPAKSAQVQSLSYETYVVKPTLWGWRGFLLDDLNFRHDLLTTFWCQFRRSLEVIKYDPKESTVSHQSKSIKATS